ncbi:MAG: hypothetical protein ABI333_22410 [bacterium]
MIGPVEICLEELFHAEEEEDERYVRCVALPGGEPGLALDREGAVQWMVEEPEHFGLWVTGDNQLALHRNHNAGPITVERGGRALEAPAGKPVILLDQDELLINGRRLRLHVHGETEAVWEPERLSGSALGRLVRAAAAAATLALGGAAATNAAAQGVNGLLEVDGRPPIEVRVRPPRVAAREPLDCVIDRQRTSRGKALRVYVTCPRKRGLYVGLHGTLIDLKTKRAIPKGAVTVKSVKGTKVVVEATQQKNRVKATAVRFWVR